MRGSADVEGGRGRDAGLVLQLFQTEWCRGSKRVRQRLTELGIDFVARQVPADPAERDVLEFHTGVRSVPVLVFEDGAVVVGAERILDYLDNLPERGDADEQRERAHRSLRRECADLDSAECDSTPSSRGTASPPAGAPTS
jgi:glutaredoxin